MPHASSCPGTVKHPRPRRRRCAMRPVSRRTSRRSVAAVDAKVGAAMAIEERRQTERAEWLAATRTVTTGAGDRAVASELVDQNVKPFVDNDIRAEWLAAMQKTMAAASAAFDDATSVLTGEPAMPFEVPGDLGPASIPSPREQSSGGRSGRHRACGVDSPPPAAVAPGLGPTAAPAPAIPAAPEPLAAPMPAAPAPATSPLPAAPTMPSTPSPVSWVADCPAPPAGCRSGLSARRRGRRSHQPSRRCAS